MNYKSIVFVVGLTGVGKSTTLDRLLEHYPTLNLLPNRRALTDEIIIPTVQKQQGLDEVPVKDRAERFAMTKAYRELAPEGMTKVVFDYLQGSSNSEQEFIFDNVRGVNEVAGVAKYFSDARILMLDAPEEVRLQRLLGRGDAFDQINTEVSEDDDPEVAKAKAILAKEKLNYDAAATKDYLDQNYSQNRYLYIDTHKLTIEEVTDKIVDWLS